jgi:DNA-binding transcriptional ArsR family regulator
MSHYMTALAMKQLGLKPAAKIVLYWLAEHHNGKTGHCFPSLNTLCLCCEMDRSTIVRHLDGLEAAGLVSRERRVRDNGSQTSTAYFLHLVPVAEYNSPCCKMQQPPVAKCHPHNLGNNNLGNEQEVATLPVHDHFADFWDAYPHRNGVRLKKVVAQKAFSEALKSATAEQIAAGVEMMRNAPDVLRGFARDPTTWLDQQGWQDEQQLPPSGDGYDPGNSPASKPRQIPQGRGNRPDPALEQIARLAGLRPTQGDDRV